MPQTQDNKRWVIIFLVVAMAGAMVWYCNYRINSRNIGPAVTALPQKISQYEEGDGLIVEQNRPTEIPTVAISPATPLGQVLLTLDKNQIVFNGLAVGTMFFEASFPVHLEDKNGVMLASGLAQADADWMTTSSVPFTATLKIVQPISPPLTGTLVLRRDNPSGLPEHDVTVTFPAILEKK